MNSQTPTTTTNDALPLEAGILEPALTDSRSAGLAADSVVAHDFRNPTLISPREMRKFWQHQEEFVQSLSRRITSQLRMDFLVTLTGLQTVIYRNFSASWTNPSNLILFKLDPLRGVGLMEIRPNLALSMVDRLMGGPAKARTEALELSEIERVLLDQSVQAILEEWAKHWAPVKDLKSTVLGYESDGNFVQVCTPETILLVITLSITLGSVADRIQIGVPFAAIEPLVRQVTREKEIEAPKPIVPSLSEPKWNSAYNEVCVPVSAQWHGIEMSLADLAKLKVGDLIPLDASVIQSTQICLGEIARFEGSPGASEGKWAVELVKPIENVK